jgi:hypothetical protein
MANFVIKFENITKDKVTKLHDTKSTSIAAHSKMKLKMLTLQMLTFSIMGLIVTLIIAAHSITTPTITLGCFIMQTVLYADFINQVHFAEYPHDECHYAEYQ